MPLNSTHCTFNFTCLLLLYLLNQQADHKGLLNKWGLNHGFLEITQTNIHKLTAECSFISWEGLAGYIKSYFIG